MNRKLAPIAELTKHEISADTLSDIIPYTFDFKFLKIAKNRHHFKKERESLPHTVQVYLDGVVECRYPLLDYVEFHKQITWNFSPDYVHYDYIYHAIPEIQRKWILDVAIAECSKVFSDEELANHKGNNTKVIADHHIWRLDNSPHYANYKNREDAIAAATNSTRKRLLSRLEKLKEGIYLSEAAGFVPTTFLARLFLGYNWACCLGWTDDCKHIRNSKIRKYYTK